MSAATDARPPKPAPSPLPSDEPDTPALRLLAAAPRWVVWRWTWDAKTGKWTKPPFQLTGELASSTDPLTWTTYRQALAAARARRFDGIGYALFRGAEGVDPEEWPPDTLVGVDFDFVVDPVAGAVDPTAWRHVTHLGSYAEVSPSRRGIRVFVRANLPPAGRKQGPFEMYQTGRYLTVTGQHLEGTPTTIEARQAAVTELHAEVFGEAKTSPNGKHTYTHYEVKPPPAMTDDELLSRIRASRQGDKFDRLWRGDWSGYGSQSEADLALCAILASWTGKDAPRMDRLFRRSGLPRDKWTERHAGDGRTYGQMTIARAIDGCAWVYDPDQPRTEPPDEEAGAASGTSGTPPAEAEEPWPARGALPPARPAVPALPPAMVPEPLRAWVEDIAARASIPLAYAAVPAVAAAGAVVGRSVGIRPKRYDDWLVVANLWGTLIGPSGWLKTHAAAEGTRPLRRLAARAHERFEEEHDEREAERERIEAQIDALKARMREAAKKDQALGDLETEMAARKHDLRAARATEPRYLTQDATVEKLGELLRDNPRGLLVLRDELGGWLRTIEREGHEGDREFFLEAWNGTGSFTTDRIGRGTIVVPALTLSVFGGVQPGKLAAYVAEAMADGAGADGLMQRMQLSIWPDALGDWREVTHWPDRAARERAFGVFEALDALDPGALGACGDGEDGIPSLPFAPDAQVLFDAWFAGLEGRVRSGEFAAAPAFESHVSKYRSLMPALALLFHLIGVAGQPAGAGRPAEGVSLAAARLAAAWCDFLEAHARKIYSAELAPGVAGAHALAAKIASGAVRHGQPLRDVYRHHWTGLGSAAEVDAAIGVLAAAGRVRVGVRETAGRPAEHVLLHPELRSPDRG